MIRHIRSIMSLDVREQQTKTAIDLKTIIMAILRVANINVMLPFQRAEAHKDLEKRKRKEGWAAALGSFCRFVCKCRGFYRQNI